MNLKVSVPKTLRWRCSNPHHVEIRETPNPCSPPVCCMPTSDWVCSTVMVTIEEYARTESTKIEGSADRKTPSP